MEKENSIEITKDYLTAEEIGCIVDNIMQQETAIAQEVVKKSLIITFCTEYNKDGKFKDLDVYNDLTKSGQLDTICKSIKNYNILNEVIESETNGFGKQKRIMDILVDFANHAPTDETLLKVTEEFKDAGKQLNGTIHDDDIDN